MRVDKFEEVMEFIEENPDRHDQGFWVCGTTACLAGWTCILNGFRPCNSYGEPIAFPDEASDFEPAFVVKGRERRSIDAAAQELLGLTRQEAEYLFHALDLAELKERAYEITNGMFMPEEEGDSE